MNIEPLEALAISWEQEAQVLRRRGAVEAAACLESAADDLRGDLEDWKLEALSLAEASEESGITYGAIQKQLTRGDIPNAGKKGKPLVRRCDLSVATHQRGNRTRRAQKWPTRS